MTLEFNCWSCNAPMSAEKIGKHRCALCGAENVVPKSASVLVGAAGVKRGRVLLDAHTIINGERQNVYGAPEDSFKLIAQYWSTYLDSKGYALIDGRDIINADDVALMMTLLKVAREANQHKRDNIVDAAGYLGIYGTMQEGKE